MKLLRKVNNKIVDVASGIVLNLREQIDLIQSEVEFRIEDEAGVDCMREFAIEVLIRGELIAVSVPTNELLILIREGDGSLANPALCKVNDMLESPPMNKLAA